MINQEKKTIAVCGDSWFSADLDYPEKSFGEILCARNDWNLVSLARNGCSNFAICLQVDKAIELKADFVIIGATTPDRSEFPIINSQNISIWQQLKETFDWQNWFNTQPDVFDKARGISNVLHTNSLSSTHEWIGNPTIISESLNNLAFWAETKLTTEQVAALREYMLNLYDSGIKRQYDSWIVSDACRRLQQNGIPFLIYTVKLYNDNYYKDIEWVGSNNVIHPSEFFLENELPWNSNTSFHYCPDTGGNIFANYIEKRMKDLI